MKIDYLVALGLRLLKVGLSPSWLFLFNLAGVQELSEAETQIPESVLKDSCLAYIPLDFTVSYVYAICSNYIHPSLPPAVGLSSPLNVTNPPVGSL